MSVSAPIHFEEFVGRRAELTFLLEQQSKVASGCGTTVLIGGEPGIGKTRLISEFCKALDFAQNWHTLSSCLEFVQSPYLPFTETFDQLFGSKDEDLDYKNPLPQSELAGEVLRSLASIDEDSKKLEVFTNVADRLRDLSKIRPIIVVIEDLQWADNASVELLEYLVNPLAKSRVFFLVSYRTETGDLRQWPQNPVARLERKGAFRIHLTPLSEADSRRLLRQGLHDKDDLPKESIDRILDLAEGNPLFIEELLRAATDNPADVTAFETASPSLRGAVLQRVQGLTKTQQRVLTLAAVIGRSFDLQFVARIAGNPLASVYEAFRRARQLHLVRQHQRELNQYEFRHAITRHILYSELLPAQALILHAKIAAELEKRGDSQVAELAFHWAAAGNSDKAVFYNETSGDRAAQLHAYRDAARLYRRALDFETESGAKRAQLCNKLAESLYRGGLPETATPWYEETLKEVTLLKDCESQVRALLRLARQCWVCANTQAAIKYIESAIDLAAAMDSPHLEIDARVRMASYCNLTGDHARAAEHLQAADQLGISNTATYLATKAISFGKAGKSTEAFVYLRRAARAANEVEDFYIQTVIFDDFANLATALGRVRTALQLRQRALTTATKRGVLWRSAYLSLRYAQTLLLSGNYQRANEFVYETLQGDTESIGVRLLLAAVGIPLALRLENEELLKLCSDATVLELALRTLEPDRIGGVAAAFVDLHRSHGHIPEAKHTMRRALRALRTSQQAWDLLLLVPQIGEGADVVIARSLLEREAAIPGHDLAKAHLNLFDAILAQRDRRRLQAMKFAKIAAEQYKGMALLPYHAHALELSDMHVDAVNLYHALGDKRSERRLKAETNGNRRRGRAGTALTRRENDIAALVTDGHTNREIAYRLKISENTVEHHLDSIFNRLGIRSRSRLAAIMAEQHLEHRLNDPMLKQA